MKKNIILLFVISALLLANCGDPGVDITEAEFEPRIVVEGYLYPGKTIKNIKLMRTYSLKASIDLNEIVLTPGNNSVTTSINGVPLTFDDLAGSYYNDNVIVEFDKPYTLVVNAIIDGRQLYTSSTTVTPKEGFTVINTDLGAVKYREQSPVIEFLPSPGTDFYAFSIVPEGASPDNFIYDNPFIPDLSRKDVEDEFDSFLYQMNALINANSMTNEITRYEIQGLDTWFYTSYKVTVYAGDKNFKDYILTANDVQEPDGNFIEPAFHFEGDGIGIFGSAIVNTVTFELVK